MPSRFRSPMPQYLAAKDWCSVERWHAAFPSCLGVCVCLRALALITRHHRSPLGETKTTKKSARGLRSLCTRVDYFRKEWVASHRQARTKEGRTKNDANDDENPKKRRGNTFWRFSIRQCCGWRCCRRRLPRCSLHILISFACARRVAGVGVGVGVSIVACHHCWHLAARPK